jgi:acetyl-CoA carboxylase carboxyl transferase subunit beta
MAAMSWLRRDKKGIKSKARGTRKEIPDGLWIRCPECMEILYRLELEKNLQVCHSCHFHFRVGAFDYLTFILDEGTFRETNTGLTSLDPLSFRAGREKYADKAKKSRQKTGLEDAVITGRGEIDGRGVFLSVMDFNFMGGSMGSVVGEKIARCISDGIDTGSPVIIVSQSGGARMQESILSLMQMAKTSAMLGRLKQAGIPFISILTHPTTGGVTASFAMLGDIIIAEPKALIGFAGPRVIKQTIQTDLPEGFQRSEFLLEHGMVDMVVGRHEMRQVLIRSLSFFGVGQMESQPVETGADKTDIAAIAEVRMGGEATDPEDDEEVDNWAIPNLMRKKRS